MRVEVGALGPEAVLAAVEKGLRDMFANGVVVDVTADLAADEFLARAEAATDPVLAAGYRELAEEATKEARQA